MRPPRFRNDTGAAMDVPFKMLVSVVLVSMAVATLYPVLQSYHETQMEHRVSLAVTEIEAAVTSAHRHPGSSRTVLIDVPSTGGIRLESLTIGSELTAPAVEAGAITWRLSSGPGSRELVTTSGGPVPMAGPGGEQVVIDRFPCLLVVEAMTAPPGVQHRDFVQVTVL
ncbi:MAG: hypothetical protein JSW25_03600 [Thermoplasmata archaeon]|nr:MAG: hypothetical protein JSW25_03600 [Thermoplasmata archaeon]